MPGNLEWVKLKTKNLQSDRWEDPMEISGEVSSQAQLQKSYLVRDDAVS